jgi:hypothetical protein
MHHAAHVVDVKATEHVGTMNVLLDGSAAVLGCAGTEVR